METEKEYACQVARMDVHESWCKKCRKEDLCYACKVWIKAKKELRDKNAKNEPPQHDNE